MFSPVIEDLQEFDYVDEGSSDRLEVCQALAGGKVVWCKEKIIEDIEPVSPSEALAYFLNQDNARNHHNSNTTSK